MQYKNTPVLVQHKNHPVQPVKLLAFGMAPDCRKPSQNRPTQEDLGWGSEVWPSKFGPHGNND